MAENSQRHAGENTRQATTKQTPSIHLFEAVINAWSGIVFSRRMMQKVEALGALGEEQGGSRKGRTSTDVYAMKFLSFQMAEITQTPLAVMDNDAKAC